jgi:hypothetical protein
MYWDEVRKCWSLDKDGGQKKLEAGIMKHLKLVFREWAPMMVDGQFVPTVVRHKALFGQSAFVARVKAALMPAVRTKTRADFDDFARTGKHIHFDNGVTLDLREGVPFDQQVREGVPEDFNTKSTLRPFRAWEVSHPEAAALWFEALEELNQAWTKDFYLKEPEAQDVAQLLLANTSERRDDRRRAEAIVAKLQRLIEGDAPKSPLLKQLMTAWEADQ